MTFRVWWFSLVVIREKHNNLSWKNYPKSEENASNLADHFLVGKADILLNTLYRYVSLQTVRFLLESLLSENEERLLSIILWSKSGVVFEEPREEINVIVVFNLTWIKEKDKYYVIQAVSYGNFHELSPSALISK